MTMDESVTYRPGLFPGKVTELDKRFKCGQ